MYFSSAYDYDGRFVDMYGIPVKRTKREYPYSYDAFRVYRRNWNTSDSVVYSDRLFEQNSSKFNECLIKIFGNTGQNFSNRYPEEIESFLSLYFDKRIMLTGIMEACNVSNGYPYWIFYYKEV